MITLHVIDKLFWEFIGCRILKHKFGEWGDGFSAPTIKQCKRCDFIIYMPFDEVWRKFPNLRKDSITSFYNCRGSGEYKVLLENTMKVIKDNK